MIQNQMSRIIDKNMANPDFSRNAEPLLRPMSRPDLVRGFNKRCSLSSAIFAKCYEYRTRA